MTKVLTKFLTKEPLPKRLSTQSSIDVPEWSEWKCYLFDNTPGSNGEWVWRPLKGQESDWFIRWMMKVCFACTWVKGGA